MDRAIILSYLCTNPSCGFSEKKLQFKTVLKGKGKTLSFDNLNDCPKCRSELELLKFNSGSVEITDDYEKQD